MVQVAHGLGWAGSAWLSEHTQRFSPEGSRKQLRQ